MTLALYKFFKFLSRYFIPLPLRYPLGRAIARGVCRFNKTRRETIIANLTPLVGKTQAAVLAPEVFGNFLMTAVDFFCTRHHASQVVRAEGWAQVDAAYQTTHRVMVVTAHIGHWEIGICYLAQKGYAVAGVYAPYTDDAIVQWIQSHRHPKVEWISTTPGAAEQCTAAIENGKILGMVADIPFGEQGRLVKIAGHSVRLPIGPFTIAARAKATVIPAFILRQSPGRYRAVIHEPILPVKGSLTRQIDHMQNLYVKHLEFYLKNFPEQWGVLAPFWSPPSLGRLR